MKKILKAHVRNLKSANGDEVLNQFEILTDDGRYFQSYQTTIVFISNDGQIYLDATTWAYSATTSRYRSLFLTEDTAETKRKIEAGEYKLVDLNSR